MNPRTAEPLCPLGILGEVGVSFSRPLAAWPSCSTAGRRDGRQPSGGCRMGQKQHGHVSKHSPGWGQPEECRRVREVLTSCSYGRKRIQLDGSRLGANGHHAQDGVVGQGAGLAGEAVLHCLPWGQAGQSRTPHL